MNRFGSVCLSLLFLSFFFYACGPGGTPNDNDAGDPDTKRCFDQCREDARQCTGNGWQLCKIQDNGCTAWNKVTPCPKGTLCNGGVCSQSCLNQCTAGTKQCIGSGIQVCEEKDNGCTDWSPTTPCGKGELCSGGTCKPNHQGCQDACNKGDKQCDANGKGIQECKLQENGCTDWSASAACPAEQTCQQATCSSSCNNKCTAGAKQCDGSSVQTCTKQSNGCTDWNASNACPSGQTCSGGTCTNQCTDQCNPNTRLCSGAGFQICKKQSNGCYDWSKTSPCANGTICSGGNCVKNCTNQCAQGAKQCSGSGTQNCEKKSNGCYDWGNVIPCSGGTICSGGQCVKNCTDQCTNGKQQCDGVRIQTCKKQASGCTEWSTTTTCTNGQACSTTTYKCVSTCTNQCNENARKCGATGGLQTCTKQSNGCTDWSTSKACPSGQTCTNGTCVKTCQDKCTLNATQCAGGLQTCTKQSNGCTDWSAPKACPSGQTCQGNVCKTGCTNLCVPGQTTCQSNRTKTCVLQGKCWTWDAGIACPSGQTCYANTCAKGSVTISQPTELCGTHVYSGTLTIQGGAKLTCKTAQLTIRAKKIFIDPASSIDLSETSSSAPGGRFRTCSRGTCYADLGRTGAGGGGNGTRGGSSLTVKYKYRSSRYGSCSCRSCPGVSGSGTQNTPYDIFVSPGGMGGSGCHYVSTYGQTTCQTKDLRIGGKGGGAIRLYAEDSITVLGKLEARGGSGQKGAAGSGGGAGGSILLAAPTIDIKGSINVAGGAKGIGAGFSAACYSGGRNTDGGAGGQGRIKIIHGDNYTNTGTLSGGVQSISWLPPMKLSSSTHPSAALYYNDTFKEFKISWKKPYTSAKGYWYALNRSQNLQLTPTNGIYTAATNLTLDASKFPQGGLWSFYVLSVHSNSKASTIANRWTLQINNKPHNLTSTSHPDPKLWYSAPTKKTFTVSWKAPSGVPETSFRGFWYKLDRNKDTAPGRAAEGWTYTTNKQVLLTQDWNNKPLDKWAYYFHLVSEDAVGNLTKVAAHYRIQLGTEPSKLNFFGYIKDASGNPIKDVELELQPYGHQVKTDANGYFILKHIYLGTYQMTAVKKGFKEVRVQVQVDASASPYHFKMNP